MCQLYANIHDAKLIDAITYALFTIQFRFSSSRERERERDYFKNWICFIIVSNNIRY